MILRAHGVTGVNDTSGHRIEPGTERVAEFYFKVPWHEHVQLLKSVFTWDNPAVVHHWGLYSLRGKALKDGTVLPGVSLLESLSVAGMEFIAGSGRGSAPLELPAEVGLRMPHGADAGIVLEIHYFNASDEPAEDHSALELCITSKLRPHEAAIHSLGRLDFDLPAHEQTEIVGKCIPSAPSEPMHVLSITPHMHARGTRAKVVLDRDSGEQRTVLDEPFLVGEQRTYPVSDGTADNEVVLQPGDTLTSSCFYDNATDDRIPSGNSIDNEMCQLFTLTWPAGALQNDGGLTNPFSASGDTECRE